MKAASAAVPLYGSRAHVCFDQEGWEQLRKRFSPPGDPMPEWADHLGSFATTYDIGVAGRQQVILRIDLEACSRQGAFGVIMHECFHAAMSVCTHVGISMTAHTDEAGAYLAQWFADFVRHHLPKGTAL